MIEKPLDVSTPDELYRFVHRRGLSFAPDVRSHFQDVLMKLSEQELVERMKADVEWRWIASELLHVDHFVDLAIKARDAYNEDARGAIVKDAARQIATAVDRLKAAYP